MRASRAATRRNLSRYCLACQSESSMQASPLFTPHARALSTHRVPESCHSYPCGPQQAAIPNNVARTRWLSQSSKAASSYTSAAAANYSSSTTGDSTTRTQSESQETEQQKRSESAKTSNPPLYYALFPSTLPQGPPPAGPFVIDVRLLRREFLRLQAAAHPDFHHAASSESSPAARRQAEATSAVINEAFRTLASPLLRAQYLLREIYAIDLAGDEAGSLGEADADVLDAVLEAREAIEEAEAEGDLEVVKAQNEQRVREAEEALADAFRAADIQRATGEAVKLRYWVNVRESVDNWEKGSPVVLQH